MSFLTEFILELLFEIPFDMAMESRRLKTGVKTALFCLLGGGIVALFVWITVSTWLDGDAPAAVVTGILTAAMTALLIYGAVRGHKRNWKIP